MVRPSLAAAILLVAAADIGHAIEVQQRPAAAESPEAPVVTGRPTGWTFQGGNSAGYDFQFGALLLGVEGDAAFDLVAGNADAGNRNIWDGQTYRREFGGGWGSLRGRAGQEVGGGILLYGTGGLALDQMNTTGNEAAAGTRAGWVAGGGAEAALAGNLSARVEYLRLDFGSFHDVGAGSEPATYKSAVDMLRVGFNYKF